MKTLALAVSSAVALMLTSAAAHADAYADIDKCELLQQEFDQVISLYPSAPNGDAARQQRAEAADLCAGGDPVAGVARLEEAFSAIGITPPSYPSAGTP
jgi:hypothetical protein